MKDYGKGFCPYCHREFELFVIERRGISEAYIEMTHYTSCKLTADEAVSIIHDKAVKETKMNGYKPINNGIPGTPPTCGSGIIDEMTEFEKQYITETGLAFFVAVEKDGSQWIRKEQWDWMLNLFTADRDKLQAEVEKWRANYETMLDGYEDVNNELQSMTARCKAADALIDKLLASYGAHIRRLIHGQPEYKTWLTLKKEAGE